MIRNSNKFQPFAHFRIVFAKYTGIFPINVDGADSKILLTYSALIIHVIIVSLLGTVFVRGSLKLKQAEKNLLSQFYVSISLTLVKCVIFYLSFTMHLVSFFRFKPVASDFFKNPGNGTSVKLSSPFIFTQVLILLVILIFYYVPEQEEFFEAMSEVFFCHLCFLQFFMSSQWNDALWSVRRRVKIALKILRSNPKTAIKNHAWGMEICHNAKSFFGNQLIFIVFSASFCFLSACYWVVEDTNIFSKSVTEQSPLFLYFLYDGMNVVLNIAQLFFIVAPSESCTRKVGILETC